MTSFLPAGSSYHRGFLAAVLALLVVVNAPAAVVEASQGMVSTTHPLATKIGVEVLKSGGNAVDAAVAVAFALGVVDGHNSGIGGGAFMLIRRSSGEFVALDGRETAPAAATRDMFIRNGKGDPDLSQTGPLASGVPGAVALYERAVRDYGRKPLAELVTPAATLAEKGFALSAAGADRLNANAAVLRKFEATRQIFVKADASPWRAGEALRQADLARSYRAIAEQGSTWFYQGNYAAAVAAWMKENGGIMTAMDFRNYAVRLREPLRTTYRGHTLVGFPPPSSGGVHVAQILNILESFDLRALADTGQRQHVVAEAMKLAFADRAHWLGDPDFAKVPQGLVGKDYAKALAARINPERASVVAGHGMPPDSDPRFFGKHTTHFSVADAAGNWVACTATINTSFGSKVVVPGTGILLNNEMDDFSIQPGVPNHFKLIGSEANAVAAGKRPLSSMSPTIVLKNNEPVLAIGAAGGPTIITQVVLGLIGFIDLGWPLDAALSQPRIHQQWVPNEVRIEQALPANVRADLVQRGHQVSVVPTMGVTHAVARSPDGKTFHGAADPRAGGLAAGW